MKTAINNFSNKKYFSVPYINYYDPGSKPLKKKINVKENYDNMNPMYKSIIINKNTKKIGSSLGESYLICNNDTGVSDLRKSEYDTIKKQNQFAKFDNGKKIFNKGTDVIKTGSNTFGILVIMYSVGKYVLPFLL